MSSLAWQQAAAAMDSVKAASAVSPLSEHGGFGGGDDDVATAQPQLSPAGMRLLSPASARGTGAAREDEPPPVLSVLARLLQQMMGAHPERPQAPASLFCGLRAPAICLSSYLERIFKYANCSPACYVFAFIYLERLLENDPHLRITSLSVHRLLVTAVLVAAKFLDDSYFNNAYYSKVGGISLGEINALEVEFLTRLSFRLHVLPEQFEAVCARLCSELTTDDAAAADAAAEAAPAEQGGAAPAGYVAGGKAYAAQAVA